MDLSELLAKVDGRLGEERKKLLQTAYAVAEKAHAGQRRESGEPFIEHPLQTAMILAGLQVDVTTIQAALLHDVVEDSGVPLADIEAQFGPEVARLVDGVTKLAKLGIPASRLGQSGASEDLAHAQAESLRKMLVAMAQDIRVVLIKLADRLHNMQSLGALPPERQRRIAQETLDIYAPLAHRMGMWEMKWQLEDLAFRHLEPEKYREVADLLASKRKEREEYIALVTQQLREELSRTGVQAEVVGRPKHLYSIYQKMQRYETMDRHFGDIYDLLAVRVMVETVSECYAALGCVHALWRPLPGQFDDYIATPRENGYRSLHTTVLGPGSKPLEVQIRTHEMHRVAEYGIAAHWLYKEGTPADMRFEERISWLRQLLDWQREVSGAEEFMEQVKTDLLPGQVFVYTPKGEVKELPAGATPLDFAFRIHTDLGLKANGAKVNGRLVSFNYQLKNGDTVEMLTAKGGKGPSLDWLNPNLGYVNTAMAREKVRQWFRRQEKTTNLARGRELLDREAKRLGMHLDAAELTPLFGFETEEELLVSLGNGSLGIHQVAGRLAPLEEKPQPPRLVGVARPEEGKALEVTVLGMGNLTTRLGACCHPVPGEEIVGFITRTRGITIHRRSCHSVLNEDEPDRLVEASWSNPARLYPVDVSVQAWDRVGLLRDITTVVSEEKVNIGGVSDRHHPDNSVTIYLTLETTGLSQLSRLLSKLEGIRGVVSVSRSSLGAKVS
ncbi:MAG: bifunctional (p)ppGpp synthetase/guanosine-3',5'-bis(diphosphate) 3'-pyrophosphohydrolase [Chloroflexi bacterium]|nr:bifunctional (p)ppGpp synthetase/guanosine-3',5'-bis(diphosphate) 3'-pyrophosphohydrolase [Chloroflexota bacterium]